MEEHEEPEVVQEHEEAEVLEEHGQHEDAGDIRAGDEDSGDTEATTGPFPGGGSQRQTPFTCPSVR